MRRDDATTCTERLYCDEDDDFSYYTTILYGRGGCEVGWV